MTSIELKSRAKRGFAAGKTTSGREDKSERARRALNVLAAVFGLIIAAPLMLVIAVLIKLTAKGPVFYTQPRVGINRRHRMVQPRAARRRFDAGGRTFTIYKFRTMNAANGNGDAQVWARPDDPRVTPLGRILRTYRLDELPQLFNVLRGDMNIVGPRPEQPDLFKDLRIRVRGYQTRQRVLPGITGWAQINHHYDASVDDVKRKLAFDLEYLTRRSTTEDFRIMLQTIPVIVFKRGAW